MGWIGAHLITLNPLGGFQDSGPGFRGGDVGGGAGSRPVWLWVTGLKGVSRPLVGKVRSQKPIISTVLPLNS